MVSTSKFVIVGLVAIAVYAAVQWQSLDSLDAGALSITRPVSETAVPVRDEILRSDVALADPAHSLERVPGVTVIHPGRQHEEVDYAAQIQGENIPPEVLSLMQSYFVEFTKGNIEYAAMLAQEALEISDDYPVVKPTLYGIIGHSYENLGYIDMAIEQHRAALEIYPLHRSSYNGMRRLDPEFAATHPPLPVPEASKIKTEIETTQ
jgi:tetratricopeptide (TPR) repeat protein